ncbi:MAG TPA: galactokinase [Vicinamibacterales bacterium]
MTVTYSAPGRVNLIGEHTDYNDGFVMPVAIDRFTRVTLEPRRDRLLIVRSAAYPDTVTIDLDRPGDGPLGTWSDYVRGVAAVLERQGWRLKGADLTITTDVPMGAGLSSSAALEVAVGYALLDQAGHAIDRTALARACQAAEHEFAGTHCGVMDQFIACHGRAGHALMLDTRTLDAAWLPVPPGVAVIVCNTMTKHALATDGYNERRADCEAGVRALAIRLPRIRALRDVTLDDLEANRDALDGRVFRRCRHVVTENARVQSAAAVLRAGDVDALGDLMRASHLSMRDDFEISTPEVDVMVESAMRVDGTIGARMTGGGFGGCTVNLVRAEHTKAFTTGVGALYEAATGRVPDIYTCVASDGAGRCDP